MCLSDQQDLNELQIHIVKTIKKLNEQRYRIIDYTIKLHWSHNDKNINVTLEGKEIHIRFSLNTLFEIYENIIKTYQKNLNNIIDLLKNEDSKYTNTKNQNPTLYYQLQFYTKLITKDTNKTIKDILLATITWIIYHELSHVNQQHFTYIQNNMFFELNETVGNSNNLNHIRHCLELYADYEAIIHSISDILNHVKNSTFELDYLLFIFNYGVASALMYFNNKKDDSLKLSLNNTHPSPRLRMELISFYVITTLKLLTLVNKKYHTELPDYYYSLIIKTAHSHVFINETYKNTKLMDNPLITDNLNEDFYTYFNELISVNDRIRNEIIKKYLIHDMEDENHLILDLLILDIKQLLCYIEGVHRLTKEKVENRNNIMQSQRKK